MQNKWLVLVVISVALFLIGIDMTVLYTALPTLTHELGASNSDKLWILNAYPLVMAGLVLGAGALGDRVGHRQIFMFGLVIFGVSSVLAAFSTSAGMLIASRALLAVGAAVMMPATPALLRRSFATDQEMGLAMGVWGSVYSGAAAVGPLIGGFLLGHFSWGSVFLINVPVVLVALVLTPIVIPTTPANPDRKWDLGNSLLVMVGLGALTYALQGLAQPEHNWSVLAVASLVGVVFLVLFVRRQSRSSAPILDLDLFHNPPFRAGVLTIIISMVAWIGVQLVLTQHLQLVEGLSPLNAGLIMIPISVTSFLAGPLIGSVLFKIGIERVLWLGLAFCGVALLAYVGVKDGPLWLKLVSLALFGFASGASVSAASTSVMINTPPEKAGMGGSIEALSYELGAVIGVAIMGSITTFLYVFNLVVPAGVVDAALAKDGLDQVLILAERGQGAGIDQLVINAKSAFDQAFVGVVAISAGIMLLLALILALTLRPQAGGGAAQTHR